jgi:hypothetical protein
LNSELNISEFWELIQSQKLNLVPGDPVYFVILPAGDEFNTERETLLRSGVMQYQLPDLI